MAMRLMSAFIFGPASTGSISYFEFSCIDTLDFWLIHFTIIHWLYKNGNYPPCIILHRSCEHPIASSKLQLAFTPDITGIPKASD